MNTKRILFYISNIANLIVLSYLSIKHIQLKSGNLSEGSLCNINETFNCDAVSASAYSELFGIPISLWGLLASLALLIFYVIRNLSDSEKANHYAYFTASFNLAISIIYAGISFAVLGIYCLFCILSYILSFFSWLALHLESKPKSFSHLAADLKDLFGDAKAYLGIFIAIPVLSFAIHDTMLGSNYKELQKSSEQILESWLKQEVKTIKHIEPAILGSEPAAMEIVEFADFNCIHCKMAAPALHSFVKSHPGAVLKFYHFPLDGNCNDAIQGPGRSCDMAKAVFCVQKFKDDKGWAAQKAMFETKEALNTEQSAELVSKITGQPKDQVLACMNDEATIATIKAQAKLGQDLGVRGTPAVFINGRQAYGGHLMPVLKRIHRHITSN